MIIMKPVLLINFKTYEQGIGKNAIKLAKIAESFGNKNVEIILAVQPSDIYPVSKAVSLPVYAQHIDPVEFGSHTGWILPEAVKEAGASGTLINHSEHMVSVKEIKKCVSRAKDVGLKTVVCAPNQRFAKALAEFGPDFIAVEPPELIGGDVSVSEAKPEVISDSVKAVKNVNSKIRVLCGAGVHNAEDVRKALQLGSSGVLIASAIVKSKNPGLVIENILEGFE